MTEASPLTSPGNSASLLLGRTIDSIPFSAYHLQLILVLGAVGFVEGYDLALGGSLLVLAKQPLHLTPEQIRWLAVAPILNVYAEAEPAALWQAAGATAATVAGLGAIGDATRRDLSNGLGQPYPAGPSTTELQRQR